MAMVQKTSLELTDRLSVEAQFFDHLKEDEGWRLARFYEWGLYRDAVDHSRISLGEIKGKQLLEFGCGLGNDTVFFAQQGAEVITFDVSESMLQRVAELIREKDLDQFVCLYHMSGEDLKLRNESVDLVYGRSVLHHLEISRTVNEIYRVLRPGGMAVFLEPLAYNPVINLFRKLTPSRRTPTERPLTTKEIEKMTHPFSSTRVQGWCLLNLAALFFCYCWPNRRLFEFSLARLGMLDRWLLSRFPALWKFCWVAVIKLQK